MRLVIYVKNENLHTGNISLKKEHVRGYWNDMIDCIDVFTEDKEFCESYYGGGLQYLMLSLTSKISDGEEFFLAKRHFMKNPKPDKRT